MKFAALVPKPKHTKTRKREVRRPSSDPSRSVMSTPASLIAKHPVASGPWLEQSDRAAGPPTFNLSPEFDRGAPAGIFAKLEVGTADDPLEREADKIADQVMRMPVSTNARQMIPAGEPMLSGPRHVTSSWHASYVSDEFVGHRGSASSDIGDVEILRACASCSAADDELLRTCESCDTEDQEIRREPAAGLRGGTTSDGFAGHVRGRVRLGGTPLSSGVRNFLEPRLGANLDDVRFHADADAGLLARQINARAFTPGKDIFFAPGQLRPQTQSGMRLLAHEVAHTLQASRSAPLSQQPSTPGPSIQRAPAAEPPSTLGSREVDPKLMAFLAEIRERGEPFPSIAKGALARKIAESWIATGKPELTLRDKQLLIHQMFYGAVGNKRERVILQLIKRSSDGEKTAFKNENPGQATLYSRIHGKEDVRELTLMFLWIDDKTTAFPDGGQEIFDAQRDGETLSEPGVRIDNTGQLWGVPSDDDEPCANNESIRVTVELKGSKASTALMDGSPSLAGSSGAEPTDPLSGYGEEGYASLSLQGPNLGEPDIVQTEVHKAKFSWFCAETSQSGYTIGQDGTSGVAYRQETGTGGSLPADRQEKNYHVVGGAQRCASNSGRNLSLRWPPLRCEP